MLGMRALPALDPDRYALTVLNQALGGGMSSRLFQEVREERGLAYSVYSYRAAYDDTGFLAIYAGTAPERVHETLGVIDDELDRLVADGLPTAELDAAKGHLTGSLAMSLETSSSRMRRIGRSEQVEGEVPPLDELVAARRRGHRRRRRARRSTACCATRRARSPSSARTNRPTSRRSTAA